MKIVSRKKLAGSLLMGLLALNWACSGSSENSQTSQDGVQTEEKRELSVAKSGFGSYEGKAADLYTLTNANGMEVEITNYGGIVVSLSVPDKNGNIEDVTLGFDSLSGYLQQGVPYFGAIIGRYGNRIAEGKFTLDGKEYQLAKNDGPNHLHGGVKGFDKVLWDAKEFKSDDAVGVKLKYLSKDMEEGYPGNLSVNVTYTLTNDNELKIDYQANTDKKTVVNLTNHAYFNLSGDLGEKVLDHVVTINADRFLPVSSTLIPTGELRSVKGTPFDFTEPVTIGARIETENQQLGYGKGYDHCWILNGTAGEMRTAATVHEPESGRFMEVLTVEPAIQFYTGNFLEGNLSGKGETFQHRSGFCLETQHFPDAPNQPEFPSVELAPGDTYATSSVYKFSVK